MPLAFPLLASVSVFPGRSLPVDARGIVECRYLHLISLTVTLQESYEEVIVVSFLVITKESACKPDLDSSVPGFRLWYRRMWHGRFWGTCYVEPRTNYFFAVHETYNYKYSLPEKLRSRTEIISPERILKVCLHAGMQYYLKRIFLRNEKGCLKCLHNFLEVVILLHIQCYVILFNFITLLLHTQCSTDCSCWHRMFVYEQLTLLFVATMSAYK